jgi:hypothetical protein
MGNKKWFGMLAFACLTACSAYASHEHTAGTGDGEVRGYVVDAVTKKPVAGVAISACSNSTCTETKIVVTDASGYFHIKALPAGQVKFKFEKKGYKQVKKESMSVKEGTTVRLNIELNQYKVDVEDYQQPFLLLDQGM